MSHTPGNQSLDSDLGRKSVPLASWKGLQPSLSLWELKGRLGVKRAVCSNRLHAEPGRETGRPFQGEGKDLGAADRILRWS